jgi:DMSO/TMAO reductase YedYZ molybdopterin-dependent catalytic subunit
MSISGCGSAASASNPTWKITIEGLGKEATFTSLDLQKTGTVTIKAAIKEKDTQGPVEEWKGVPLSKALAYVGVSQYTTIKVESTDGTAKEYTPDLVDSKGTVLGIEVNGKALDRDKGPVQLVVDGKGSNWWIKQVAKITVIK